MSTTSERAGPAGEAERTRLHPTPLTPASGPIEAGVSPEDLEAEGLAVLLGAGGRDPYEGLREINRGGMGVIFSARDRSTEREVAIKMLTPDALRDPVLVRRFLEEARFTAQLEHPNIVPVHHLGLTGERQPFFAMKRVEGQSLSELLRAVEAGDRRARGYTLARLLGVFLKVCDALRFAHARDVIHRDLKPDNIMIGRFGEVLVMDWGLAKQLGGPESSVGPQAPAELPGFDSNSDIGVTLPGTILGTACYMPPEQAVGEGERVDRQSDIYSLGAVLYEILTLRPPFEGRNVMEILEQVAVGELRLPSEANPARPVPRELEGVVLKAMAHSRRDRYKSVRALQDEIEAYLEGRTLRGVEYSPVQRVVKWIARHRALAGSAAALVVLAVGLGLFFRWEARREIPSVLERAAAALEAGDPDRARELYAQVLAIDAGHAAASQGRADALVAAGEARERARGAERRNQAARAVAQARSLLAGVPTAAALGPASTTEETPAQRQRREQALEAYLAAASALDRAIALDPDNAEAAQARRQAGLELGRVALRGRDYTLARRAFTDLASFGAVEGEVATLLRQVEDTRGQRLRDRARRLAEMLTDVSAGLSREGRPPGAAALEDYVLEAIGYSDPQTVKILGRRLEALAARAQAAGRGMVWTQADRDVSRLCCRVLGRLAMVEAVTPLATFLATVWDQELAAEAGEALCNTRDASAFAPLVQSRTRLGGNSLAWRRIQRRLGRVPQSQGQLTSARDYDLRAGMRLAAGDAAGAIEDYDRAVALEPGMASLYSQRAQARVAAGDTAGALSDFGRALQLAPRGPKIWLLRGNLYRQLGQGARSIADYTQAVRLDPALAEAWHNRGLERKATDRAGALADFTEAIRRKPDYANAYNSRGDARREAGDLDGALSDLNRAVQLDPAHAYAYNNRGIVHQQRGRLEDAARDYSRAIELQPRYAIAHFNRASVGDTQGRIAQAIQDLTRAIVIDPNLSAAWINRADLYRRTGEPRKAVTDLTEALRLRPNFHRILVARSRVRLESGDEPGALADLNLMLQRVPQDTSALYRRGLLYRNRGDHARAVADWRRFLELAPRSDQAAEVRAYLEQR